MNGSADTEIALFLRRVKWAVMGAFALWVLWLLAPILTPFVVALMLAWQLLRHYRGRQRPGWATRWWTGWRPAAARATPR